MSDEVIIRPYTPEDLDTIMALEHLCFTDAWSADNMKACPSMPVVRAWVATRADQVIGYVIGYLIPPEGEVANVCVSPDERGKGIAKALMETMMDASGCTEFFLEVRASNRSAIGLYHRLGFEVLGVRKRYYDKPREDAIVMGLTRESEKGE